MEIVGRTGSPLSAIQHICRLDWLIAIPEVSRLERFALRPETRSFNTATSMGRLSPNILLSFAQFEREVTAERIRDKVAASRKKGMWMDGAPPYGDRVDSRKLVVDEDAAEHVRWIFTHFLEVGSSS
ncbi:Resolvase [Celeribacter indicus]|uniref:Resolvase n=1 Tax=Celeribacter indicus TaxID=1208324 RepID=A0A0B5E2J6_9RHOB|nr:Resolvase [Celeribacter indicus]